mgnify:FL=1
MSVLSEKKALLISGFIKSFITKECVSESSFNNLFSTDSLTSKVAFTYKFSAYLPPHLRHVKSPSFVIFAVCALPCGGRVRVNFSNSQV